MLAIKFFVSAVTLVVGLLCTVTTTQNIDISAKEIQSNSVKLSWETSPNDSHLYSLQRAPTAYGIPQSYQPESFKFNLDNYVKFPDITWSPSNFQIKLQVRTFTNHTPSPGVLVYMESQSHDEFVLLGVDNTTLFLKLVCGVNRTEFAVPVYDFSSNSGKWHDIIVTGLMGNISVSMNTENYTSIHGYACNTKSSITDLYLGGLPSEIAMKRDFDTDNSKVSAAQFIGCVRDVSIDGKVLKRSEAKANNQKVPERCYVDVERGIQVGSRGYVKYSGEINSSEVQHHFRFKTRRQNWVLLYVRDKFNSFYSLRLDSGYMVFSSNSANVSLDHEKPLCDNEWHEVLLYCKNISCDVQYKNIISQTVSTGISLPGSSLYMGGFPGQFPTTNKPTKDSYKGCLQDLSFIQNTKYIEHAEDVDFAGCPVEDDDLPKCSDILYENKYIGYGNSFQDENLVSDQEYMYRVRAKASSGKEVWSDWITKRTTQKEDCDRLKDYLLYVIIGGALVGFIILLLIIIIIVLIRKRKRFQEANSDLSMKERKHTAGQRYVQNDRNQSTNIGQGSGDPLVDPYDVSDGHATNNTFDSGQRNESVNIAEEQHGQPHEEQHHQQDEILYQNVPRGSNLEMRNAHYDDSGELIYQNVGDEEEMYGNSEVIRNSWHAEKY